MSEQDEDLQASSELNTTKHVFRKQSKKSYTRDFLLSFNELEICKAFPSEFDRSILHEFYDAPDSILLKQGTPGIVLSWIPKVSECGSSPTRWESGTISKGECGKWQESRFQGSHDPDYGRRYSHQSQRSWQNSEDDSLLGSGAFYRVSKSVGEDSAPKVQENAYNQLSKSANPYRPPHSYKEIPNPGRESNDSSTGEAFDSAEPQNEKRAEENRQRASFESMSKEQQRETQEKQKHIGTEREEHFDPVTVSPLDVSGKYKRFVNKSEECVKPMESDSSPAKCSLATRNPACVPFVYPRLSSNFPETNPGIKSVTLPPKSKHQNDEGDETIAPILPPPGFVLLPHEVASMKKPAGNRSSPRKKGANGGSNGLITEHSLSNLSSDINELKGKPTTSTSAFGAEGVSKQFYGCAKPDLTRENLKHDVLGISTLSDNNDDKATQFRSAQRLSVRDLGSVNSANDFSFFQNGTAFSELRIESTETGIKVNDSSYDEDWAEIESILRMQREFENNPVGCDDEKGDSTADIIWHDEDSLIASEDAITPYKWNPMPETASIVKPEQDLKLSLEHEIHLPDEDSLITIDDLISGSDSLKADELASNVKVDISCSREVTGSRSRCHNLNQRNPGRSSFHISDRNQAPTMNSQNKLTDPKTISSSPPLHSSLRANTHSLPLPLLKTPAKPKRFNHHTVQYSLSQQPISFPRCQQHELVRGAVFPSPVYPMPYNSPDLNHIVPLNFHQPSYEGFWSEKTRSYRY